MMWWLLVLTAYLLGSVPFAYLITRDTVGVDVRTVGSRNPGATNVLRVAGRRPALIVLLLDVTKGLLPVLCARVLGAPAVVLGATAVAAVVGHVFPLFLGLRGGKGVATAFGTFLSLAAPAAVASAIVFAAVLGWTRYVSLASVLSVATFPVWLYLCVRLEWLSIPVAPLLAATIATAVLVVARHSGNLRRIAAGREDRLGERVEVGLG